MLSFKKTAQSNMSMHKTDVMRYLIVLWYITAPEFLFVCIESEAHVVEGSDNP